MKHLQDAYGQAIYDFHSGEDCNVVIEQDDGYIDLDAPLKRYFSEYRNWAPYERLAIKCAKGRVLDVGCGAGRHSLHLQKLGLNVLAIDISPLAIKTCRLRGLRNTKVLSIDDVDHGLGTFDTIVMLGNNFGLVGSWNKARSLLKRFQSITSDRGCIIAGSADPYDTKNAKHLEYHRRNKQRRRTPGQLRIRVRYQNYMTPWFDYLLVSKEEMKRVVDGTGWKIQKIFSNSGPRYIALLIRHNDGIR